MSMLMLMLMLMPIVRSMLLLSLLRRTSKSSVIPMLLTLMLTLMLTLLTLMLTLMRRIQGALAELFVERIQESGLSHQTLSDAIERLFVDSLDYIDDYIDKVIVIHDSDSRNYFTVIPDLDAR
jgi:hypothetical protein